MRSSHDRSREARTRAAVVTRNAGGTYAAAARRFGLSAASLSAWNRGARVPREQSLQMLRAVS